MLPMESQPHLLNLSPRDVQKEYLLDIRLLNDVRKRKVDVVLLLKPCSIQPVPDADVIS